MKLAEAVELYRTGKRPEPLLGWWVVVSTKTWRVRAVFDPQRDDDSYPVYTAEARAQHRAKSIPERRAVFLTRTLENRPHINEQLVMLV